jgi:hypothetical protein
MIGAIGIFQIVTIRQGHGWGDDFAMYIQQGEETGRDLPTGDSGYIYNPHYPELGPPAYPPLYPLLLVRIYRHFGLSLGVMKMETVLCFLLALSILSIMFASNLLFSGIIVLIAVLGFSPFFLGREGPDRKRSAFLCSLHLGALPHGPAATAHPRCLVAFGVPGHCDLRLLHSQDDRHCSASLPCTV